MFSSKVVYIKDWFQLWNYKTSGARQLFRPGVETPQHCAPTILPGIEIRTFRILSERPTTRSTPNGMYF